MTINFRPINKHDINYSKVIDLFFEAFPKIQRLPQWIDKKIGRKRPSFKTDPTAWRSFLYYPARLVGFEHIS